ncbi:MAG: hypothetical protein ACRC42_02555 [Mycoplasma sp.]
MANRRNISSILKISTDMYTLANKCKSKNYINNEEDVQNIDLLIDNTINIWDGIKEQANNERTLGITCDLYKSIINQILTTGFSLKYNITNDTDTLNFERTEGVASLQETIGINGELFVKSDSMITNRNFLEYMIVVLRTINTALSESPNKNIMYDDNFNVTINAKNILRAFDIDKIKKSNNKRSYIDMYILRLEDGVYSAKMLTIIGKYGLSVNTIRLMIILIGLIYYNQICNITGACDDISTSEHCKMQLARLFSDFDNSDSNQDILQKYLSSDNLFDNISANYFNVFKRCDMLNEGNIKQIDTDSKHIYDKAIAIMGNNKRSNKTKSTILKWVIPIGVSVVAVGGILFSANRKLKSNRKR